MIYQGQIKAFVIMTYLQMFVNIICIMKDVYSNSFTKKTALVAFPIIIIYQLIFISYILVKRSRFWDLNRKVTNKPYCFE